MKWFVFTLLILHGIIHFPGAAKGFGWAKFDQLKEPITRGAAVVWLASGVLMLTSALLILVAPRWWWVVGSVAIVVSQAVIFTSWSDAKFGTVANIGLLLATVYSAASEGPGSFRAEYRRGVAQALSLPRVSAIVTQADLVGLPAPVAAYVRASGAVGRPRVNNFRARIHGAIRGGPAEKWMPFTGEQFNQIGPEASRLFHLDATRPGIPIDVLHSFVGPSATMRVKGPGKN